MERKIGSVNKDREQERQGSVDRDLFVLSHVPQKWARRNEARIMQVEVRLCCMT
jgi:hypothetical protein